MTLVVVRRMQKAIIAVGDTKLTPESAKSWTIIDQANKLIQLSNGWCVGYAGNVHYADQALSALSTIEKLSFTDIKEVLLRSNTESLENRSEVEFLLFSHIAKSVWKFSGGSCQQQTGSQFWIGDHLAFSKFQSIYHRKQFDRHPLLAVPPTDTGGLLFSPQVAGDSEVADSHSQMVAAMRGIIGDGGTPAVGGFPITLVAYDNTSRFWPSVMAAAPLPPNIPSSSYLNPMFGDAASGDYSYDIITSKGVKDNLVIVHLRLADTAILFQTDGSHVPKASIHRNVVVGDTTKMTELAQIPLLWRFKVDLSPDGAWHLDAG